MRTILFPDASVLSILPTTCCLPINLCEKDCGRDKSTEYWFRVGVYPNVISSAIPGLPNSEPPNLVFSALILSHQAAERIKSLPPTSFLLKNVSVHTPLFMSLSMIS